MTRVAKLLARVEAGHIPRFREFQSLAEAFGFELQRVSGSHHIVRHPLVQSNLNIQPEGKSAKPYQVRQFLLMVKTNDLTMKDGQ